MNCTHCKDTDVPTYVIEFEQVNMAKKEYACQTCYDDLYYGQDQIAE